MQADAEFEAGGCLTRIHKATAAADTMG